ncbi:MAG: hypothetical protein HUU38_07250 [Anaerolineales bacterium]|nr:hypothetical protein [Anaerolineales bacterium]
MNRKIAPVSILAFVALAIFGLTIFDPLHQIQTSEALGLPQLSLNPDPANIVNPGETITVAIQLAQISDAFGIELEMTYDPAIVQIVDSDPGTSGVQINAGACPAPDFVIQNTAYNITGTLNYAVTQFTLPGCTGGTVAEVTFQGLANGTSAFTFATSLIADSGGISVTHTAQSGLIIVGPTPVPTETPIPTNTATPTPTGSVTATHTPTPTLTKTGSPTPTATGSPPATHTPTPTGTPALLSLQPASSDILPWETANLTVQLDNVANVYGIDFSIVFDPTKLSVIDANTILDGVQIATGSCPQPDSVLFNTVNNTNGSISYAVTQLNPTLPCNGGDVATIQFQCLDVNTSSQISFIKSIIASPDEEIPHTVANAVVNCTGNILYMPFIQYPLAP